MRNPDYFEDAEKTRDKAAEILDKSGLAYFVAVQKRENGKPLYHTTHGKIGETHFSYELVLKATVEALKQYNEARRIQLLKSVGKKLGLNIEVTK